MENIDLKEIERRAYLTYHKDGILDIYLGLGIMTVATVFFHEVFMYITGTIALLPILYAGSKKQYTIPRLGYVKFSQSTQGRARNSVTLALLLGSMSAVAGFFAFYSVISSGYSWIEPLIANWRITLAVILLGVFSLFGYVVVNKLHVSRICPGSAKQLQKISSLVNCRDLTKERILYYLPVL